MSNVAIESRWVNVPNGDVTLDAYLACPTAAGNYPIVVVIQEIFGVNSHIRDVTERIAKLGYLAIAPAIYQRIAPGFEAGYTAEDIKRGREYKGQTDATELLSDIQAAIAVAKAQPSSAEGPVGSIGFCFGGHVVYLAATLPEIQATASFYGAGITTGCPGGGPPTVTRTQDIKGTLYAFFGMEDASIPADHVNEIEAALTTHQVPHQIFRYAGADHGFFCDQRGSYNAEAANEAWQVVQTLFQDTLKPSA
jgi:carboxymethylenebutenolidase